MLKRSLPIGLENLSMFNHQTFPEHMAGLQNGRAARDRACRSFSMLVLTLAPIDILICTDMKTSFALVVSYAAALCFAPGGALSISEINGNRFLSPYKGQA